VTVQARSERVGKVWPIEQFTEKFVQLRPVLSANERIASIPIA
jgi:hypothetical protein